MCPGVSKSFGTDSAMNTNYFSNTYSKNTNHFSYRVLLYRVVRKYECNLEEQTKSDS